MKRTIVRRNAAFGFGRLMFHDWKSPSNYKTPSVSCYVSDWVFRPEGLWVWGHTKYSKIVEVNINMRPQNRDAIEMHKYACPGPLNPDFVTVFHTLKNTVRRSPVVLERPDFPNRNVFWDHMLPGDSLQLKHIGPMEAMVVWGTAFVVES